MVFFGDGSRVVNDVGGSKSVCVWVGLRCVAGGTQNCYRVILGVVMGVGLPPATTCGPINCLGVGQGGGADRIVILPLCRPPRLTSYHGFC